MEPTAFSRTPQPGVAPGGSGIPLKAAAREGMANSRKMAEKNRANVSPLGSGPEIVNTASRVSDVWLQTERILTARAAAGPEAKRAAWNLIQDEMQSGSKPKTGGRA